MLLVISCQETKKEPSATKPYILLELENNQGKELVIESPFKFKKQKIAATNGRHSLDFDSGDVVYLYDAENKNYLLANGTKNGALIKILEDSIKLQGDYSNFENLNIDFNTNDIAFKNYLDLLAKPYFKLLQSPSNFDYDRYQQGIHDLQTLNDSILQTNINDNTKINILLKNLLGWKFLRKQTEEAYFSDNIDTTKVATSLLNYYQERRFGLVNFNVGDSIDIAFLESSKPEDRIDIGTLNKKVTVLFFTAKWCAPCKNYIEPLKKVQQKYPSDIEIIAVNFDENEKEYQDYQKELPFTFVSELVRMNDSKNSQAFHINALPDLIVMDHNKKVLLNKVQSNYLESYMDGIMRSIASDNK
jgi:nucleoredoxin